MSSEADEVRDALKEWQESLRIERETKPLTLIERRKLMSPYYKEHFAKELIPTLDAMIADRLDREFLFEHYPHHRRNTLYLKVQQSFLYVIDHDKSLEQKYKALRGQVLIKKTRTGVRLSIITALHEKPLVPVKVDKEIQPREWKSKVNDFLEQAQVGDKLLIDKISITEDDIKDLELSLYGVNGIVYKLSSTSIKILKVDNEVLEKLSENTEQQK